MGQGQEERALAAVQEAAQLGGWVVLQNVHLMQEWLKASKYLISNTDLSQLSLFFVAAR